MYLWNIKAYTKLKRMLNRVRKREK